MLEPEAAAALRREQMKFVAGRVMLMLRTFAAVFLRELTRLWRDKDLRQILIAGPPGLTGILWHLQQPGDKKHSTAIVDLDRSQESRKIVEYIEKPRNLNYCP